MELVIIKIMAKINIVSKSLKINKLKQKGVIQLTPLFLTKEVVCDCYDAYYLSKIGNNHFSDLDISSTSGDLEISIARCAGKCISG